MWAALTNTLPYWFLSKCFVCDRPSRTDSNANTVYIESIPLALFSSSCPVFRYLTVLILYNLHHVIDTCFGYSCFVYSCMYFSKLCFSWDSNGQAYDDLVDYFERTWLNGNFSLSQWNVHLLDGPRTNNLEVQQS